MNANAAMDISQKMKNVFQCVVRVVSAVNVLSRMFASVISDTWAPIAAFSANVTDIQIAEDPISWTNASNAIIIRSERSVKNANRCSSVIHVTMANVKGTAIVNEM